MSLADVRQSAKEALEQKAREDERKIEELVGKVSLFELKKHVC